MDKINFIAQNGPEGKNIFVPVERLNEQRAEFVKDLEGLRVHKYGLLPLVDYVSTPTGHEYLTNDQGAIAKKFNNKIDKLIAKWRGNAKNL